MKIEDIAKIANVSKSTVSLALNDKPGVSEITKERILKIAMENNYIPLRKTRVENRFECILLVVIDDSVITEEYFKLPFFNELLGNLSSQAALLQYDYSTTAVKHNSYKQIIDKYSENLNLNGLILLGTNLSKSDIEYSIEKIKNLVILDSAFEDINANFVSINNYLGAYSAGKHLISLGHLNIGYIMGEERINNYDQRLRGFTHALDSSSVDTAFSIFKMKSMQPNLINDTIDRKKLVKYLKKMTAIFCENDYMALDIIKSLKYENINIPDDLSVIGFDDINEASAIRPQLSTLRVPKFELVKDALNILFENHNTNNATSRHILINPTLEIRKSTTILNK